MVDVLHLAGFSVSYSEVLKFQKFDDFVGDSELESEDIFWKFIVDTFNHN